MIFHPRVRSLGGCYLCGWVIGVLQKHTNAIPHVRGTVTFCPVYAVSGHLEGATTDQDQPQFDSILCAPRGNSFYRITQGVKLYAFVIGSSTANLHCKVLDDNSGTIEIATNHQFCPHSITSGLLWIAENCRSIISNQGITQMIT